MNEVNERGLVLVGCGFMGKALLQGWLANGIAPEAVTVQDPTPNDWLSAQPGLRVNTPLPSEPAAIIIATKPQILTEILPDLASFGNRSTLFVSVAAGAAIASFEAHLGSATPVIRSMPNLPASIGAGVTALIANPSASPAHIELARDLFQAVGAVVELDDEDQMHAVTALSGSGPAYIFAMTEALAKAGMDHGLPRELAMTLARQTVLGAGQMLRAPDADAEKLRVAVTSPGGTTGAGLAAFMDGVNGIVPLAKRTVAAARRRSLELSEV
ncbi:MAG: pyrroline-5-carboxylate reductase [Geminicoccaceae bacterium]